MTYDLFYIHRKEIFVTLQSKFDYNLLNFQIDISLCFYKHIQTFILDRVTIWPKTITIPKIIEENIENTSAYI